MRDEKDCIAQMIESVAKSLGTDLVGIVLIDTGSVDDTVEIAKNTISNLTNPLEVCAVEHQDWVNFGHNRTQLLHTARQIASKKEIKYLLMMDPDTIVEGTTQTTDLDGDVYDLEILGVGNLSYRLPHLFSTSRDWEYVGPVHEVLVESPAHQYLETLKVHNRSKSNHVADGRYESDRKVLMDAIDKRSLFYLAQTERDLGNRERAAELYEMRASLGGWEEEVYYSLFQAGSLQRSLEKLLKAFEFCPRRGEALYEALGIMRQKNMWLTAYGLAAYGNSIEMPSDHTLFLEPWVYEWGLKFEYSVISYWVGNFDECISLGNELLDMNLPQEYLSAIKLNNQLAAHEINEVKD